MFFEWRLHAEMETDHITCYIVWIWKCGKVLTINTLFPVLSILFLCQETNVTRWVIQEKSTEYKPGLSIDLNDHVSTLRHVNWYTCTYTQNLTAVQIYSNKTTNKHFLLQSELPSWSEDKHFSSKVEFLPSKAPCHTGSNHQQHK
jgi:hypothetical protein